MKSDFLTALVIVAIGTVYVYREDIRDTLHFVSADEQVQLKPINAMLQDANSMVVNITVERELPKHDVWTIHRSVRTTLSLFSTSEVHQAEIVIANELEHRGYRPTNVTIGSR